MPGVNRPGALGESTSAPLVATFRQQGATMLSAIVEQDSGFH